MKNEFLAKHNKIVRHQLHCKHDVREVKDGEMFKRECRKCHYVFDVSYKEARQEELIK